MRDKALGTALFVFIPALLIAFFSLTLLLAARVRELGRTNAWPGYSFRIFKFVFPFTGFWGFTPGDLVEVIRRAKGDPRYRAEQQMAWALGIITTGMIVVGVALLVVLRATGR